MHKHPSSAVDVMRLDLLMQYYSRLGGGIAALQWADHLGGGPLIQAHLVALLYGHTLRVHRETRDELFARVGALAQQNVRSKGATGFLFAPWSLTTGIAQRPYALWPWQIVPPVQLTAPTIYSAVLKLGEASTEAPSGRWLELEMSPGLEHVLLPSCPLIAITGLSQSADRETRYLLARLLWQMNRFWETPNQIALFNEAVAYAAADAAIHPTPFRM